MPEPLLGNYHNIECRDAVLAWDAVEPLLDGDGKPVTRWDGRTTKTHPVTGEQVPDETARTPAYRYVNPRPAEWPAADFVVGNPPFIGNKRMRYSLGDGYVEAIRKTYSNVPESADYVMYWWEKAAELVRQGAIARFGLITTNSITQTQSRQVVERWLSALDGVSIIYAVPDHPWVDIELGAKVRISMTVVAAGTHEGRLAGVVLEVPSDDGSSNVTLTVREGRIASNLQIGADVAAVVPLRSNSRLCWQGCKLVGEHFQISLEDRERFLQRSPGAKRVLKRYWAGTDVTKIARPRYVIDFFGLDEREARGSFPRPVSASLGLGLAGTLGEP